MVRQGSGASTSTRHLARASSSAVASGPCAANTAAVATLRAARAAVVSVRPLDDQAGLDQTAERETGGGRQRRQAGTVREVAQETADAVVVGEHHPRLLDADLQVGVVAAEDLQARDAGPDASQRLVDTSRTLPRERAARRALHSPGPGTQRRPRQIVGGAA